MRTAPASREFLGPRPRQLTEIRITRSSAHKSEAADQQAPITIKAVRGAGDPIDEIQAPLDRCLAAGDLVWFFGHWQSSSRRRIWQAVSTDAVVTRGALLKLIEVIDTSKENLYTVPPGSRLVRRQHSRLLNQVSLNRKENQNGWRHNQRRRASEEEERQKESR